MVDRLEVVREKVAFDQEHRGYRFVGTYLTSPSGDALIEIFKAGALVEECLWPAYKIWNIPAHADDIVDDIENGLREAGSTGFGGNVYVG